MGHNTYITTTSVTDTLDLGYGVYLVNATTPITLTLPLITTDGMNFRLVREDTNDVDVTIQGTGANLIYTNSSNGTSTIKLLSQTSIEVQSYSNDWYTVDNSSLYTPNSLQSGSSTFYYPKTPLTQSNEITFPQAFSSVPNVVYSLSKGSTSTIGKITASEINTIETTSVTIDTQIAYNPLPPYFTTPTTTHLHDVGRSTSMVLVQSNPAISYYDASSRNLWYMRSTDATGNTWGAPISVDSTTNTGEYTSMIVATNPAIAYYDSGNDQLKFCRATDATGTAWGTPIVIGTGGQYCSMKLISSNPAIAYKDSSNTFYFVRSTSAIGDSGTWDNILQFPYGTMGGVSLLELNPVRPGIAFFAVTGGVYYTSSTSATGGDIGSWTNPPSTVDSGAGTGTYLSSVGTTGAGFTRPSIAYYKNIMPDGLYYVRANDVTGGTWPSPVGIAPGNVGQYNSIALIDSHPAISYYDASLKNLNYIRATNSIGGGWNLPVIVDSAGDVGSYTSLISSSGTSRPLVSYYDATKGNLKFAASTGNGTLSVTWSNKEIDISVAQNYGTYTSIINTDLGFVGISYRDILEDRLTYMQSTNTTGTIWAPAVGITGATGGYYTSLQSVSGNPAVSFVTGVSGTVDYVRATNTIGSSWDPVIVVDSHPTLIDTSMQIVNGNPAIAYAGVSGSLGAFYKRATDTVGSTWPATSQIISPTIVMDEISMKIIGGTPCVIMRRSSDGQIFYSRSTDDGVTWATPINTGFAGSYLSLGGFADLPGVAFCTANELRYMRASTISGTSWTSTVVANTVSGFTYSTLISFDSFPAIIYYDIFNGSFRIVQANDITGSAWGSAITIDTGSNVGIHNSAVVYERTIRISYYDLNAEKLKYASLNSSADTFIIEWIARL